LKANTEKPTTIRSVLSACSGDLFIVLVLSLFINLLMLTLPFYMLNVFDKVLGSRSEETLLMLTIAAGAALLTFGVLYAVRARVLSRFGTKFDLMLGERTLAALVSRSLQANGRTGTQGMRDLNTVRQFISGNEITSLFDAPWLPIYLFVIFMFHPLLGWTATIGAIVLIIIAVVNEYVTRKPLGAAGEARQQAMSRADTIVRNSGAVDAMGMLPSVLQRWRSDENKALIQQVRASDRIGLLTGLSRFVRFFVQILTLGVGVYLVINQEATPGIMIAAALLLGRALAPVESAIGTWRSLVNARQAAKRVDGMLNATPMPEPGMPLPQPAGNLSAERLTFAPAGSNTPVLKGVNFQLEAGESLGVVGPSAAGKSTLVKLMVGSWRPNTGHIRLDGADVASWDSADRGRYVGYLPQDVELLGDTVWENISRMDANANTDDVVAAAKLAGVHDLILQLPNGYDTRIGETGTFLSPGQRQRIALARAVYGQPSLVVMDEPNASLDQQGEQALMQAIQTLKENGATVVVVSHKPALLQGLDKVMVLRDGQVQLMGPRAEVLPQITQGAARPRVVNKQ
jgi:PrtD family type I secretion system ABC transporter